MSLLNLIGIQSALASTAPATKSGGSSSMFLMLLLFAFVFYFILIRPQQKRAKAQKALTDRIAVGDEVATIGGIIGKVKTLRDDLVVIAIDGDVSLTLRKSAVDTILPKGTLNDE